MVVLSTNSRRNSAHIGDCEHFTEVKLVVRKAV